MCSPKERLVRPLLCVPLIALLLLGMAQPSASQPAQKEEEHPVMKALREAKLTRGPATAQLESIAEIKLPQDFAAAKGDDTRRIMEAMENPPTGREVGTVFSPALDWFVVFEFDDIGYVRDDEKKSLDANAMLESIKQANEGGNKEREKRGWAKLTIVGWEQPPRYDEQTHNLTWAVRAESRGEPVINYNTRLLGRNGVMRVIFVTDPQTLPQALPQFRSLLAGYAYTKGNRYAEWVQGNKVAAVGLTALVTGGAAAVAVKSGIGKWLWKVLAAAGIGGLVLLRKLFKRETT
jgi:uncharacterized membrane-anchored protein